MFKAARASMLIILLACSAQAGYMPSGSDQPPPPPPSQPVSSLEAETAAEGETPDDATDTLAEAALSVLDSVLALL